MSAPIRTRARSFLRAGANLMLGEQAPDVMRQLIRRDERAITFNRAVELVNYERVEGDILEFGVFGGLTLALLAHAQRTDPKGTTRRIVGFDSFRGLPASGETHARWVQGECATMHSWHPLLDVGDAVSAEIVRRLFDVCRLRAPDIEEGPFDETLPRVVPSKYEAAAIVHVDCDLYESTKLVLEAVAPALQEGTVLLFDDWFHYRGNPTKGEARAFHEFLEEHPEWAAQQYQPYGTFCNSFVMYRS